MKIKIAGELQEMAASEILDHVPASAYKRIKAKDEKAEFRAYCIGHEGESSGPVVGLGKVVKKWAKAAINRIHEKLILGTKVFHLHQPGTNEHEGRKPIGEVVGKTLADTSGRLSSIAIIHIHKDFTDIPLDIASIEADITFPENVNPNARSIDVDVEEITGIALGNSEVTKPGFAGATLLAACQEFAESVNHEKPDKKETHKMTPEELKKAVHDGRLRPSDIFDDDELSGDPIVRGIVREKREAEDGYQRRQDKKLEAELEKERKEKADLQVKLDATSKVVLKTKADEIFKATVEKRNLDERQAAFVLKNQQKFSPSTEDALTGDLNKFIDAQIDDYRAVAEVFGVAADGKGKPGVGAGKAGDTSVDDLLTPDNLRKDETKK